jgi:quercetin dioxygenase-like cupin family protein
MHIPKAGTIVPQHSHAYDHTSFVASGSVAVRGGPSGPSIVQAPAPIFIPAGVKHSFTSLEDNTLVLCIHNVSRAGFVEVREEHQIVGD